MNMVYKLSYFFIEMSAEAFASVNVPFSAISILLNILFVYCMVVPQQGSEQLKEPLKVLLSSLVGCNIIIHSCSFLIVLNEFVFSEMVNNYYTVYLMPNLILSVMIYTMMTIIASCHCKNMFYFFQIVPLQNSLQINQKIRLVDFWTRLGFFFLSFSVMLASSYATVLYLWRHMKNVEDSGLVSPRLHRQIKMTITGITVQALLHFLCSEGIIIVEIVVKYSRVSLDWNGYILYTIISVYSFGTTINMMVSQSLFRQRAAQI